MAEHATAQERLFALRETIARLEGKAVPALVAARQAKAAQAPQDMAKELRRLPLGVPALRRQACLMPWVSCSSG